MNELAEIIAAFDELCENDKPAALALVIGVEGSAYRRPGARMLIAEDGRSWGGVSGGCLERDVARRGRSVIATEQAIVCTYDDDDGISATGCGGIVKILIQPLSRRSPGPVPILKDVVKNRRQIRAATVIRSGDSAATIGDCIVQDPDLKVRLDEDDYFIETIMPSQSLIIFGDG